MFFFCFLVSSLSHCGPGSSELIDTRSNNKHGGRRLRRPGRFVCTSFHQLGDSTLLCNEPRLRTTKLQPKLGAWNWRSHSVRCCGSGLTSWTETTRKCGILHTSLDGSKTEIFLLFCYLPSAEPVRTPHIQYNTIQYDIFLHIIFINNVIFLK